MIIELNETYFWESTLYHVNDREDRVSFRDLFVNNDSMLWDIRLKRVSIDNFLRWASLQKIIFHSKILYIWVLKYKRTSNRGKSAKLSVMMKRELYFIAYRSSKHK